MDLVPTRFPTWTDSVSEVDRWVVYVTPRIGTSYGMVFYGGSHVRMGIRRHTDDPPPVVVSIPSPSPTSTSLPIDWVGPLHYLPS